MNGQLRPVLLLCLWAAAFLLFAVAIASPGVLANLGLTTLLDGVSDSGRVWLSLLSASAGAAVVAGLLFLLRRSSSWARSLPLFDFVLVLLAPSVGLWVSLKRALFASESADLLAIIEPFLISLVVPLMLFGMGTFLLLPFPTLRKSCRASRSPFLLFFSIANLAGAIGWAILLWVLALAGLWKAGVIWGLVSAMAVVSVIFLFKGPRKLPKQTPEGSEEEREKPSLTPEHCAPAKCHSRESGNPERRRRVLRFLDPRFRGDDGGLNPFHTPTAASSPTPLPEKMLCFFALVLLFCTFQLAWLPPDDSDELRYHLSIPKRYLETGGWVEIPDQAFSHFPLGMEMLFSVPLSLDVLRDPEHRLGLVSGGKFVHAWFFLLCLILLLVWSRELEAGGKKGGETGSVPIWSLWVFLTLPFAPVLAAWAFVDFGSAFGWLSSALFISMFFRSLKGESCWIWLAGLALGWSLMVKYTGLAWMAIFLVVWSGWILVGRRWKDLRTLLPLVVVPPLLAAPWLICNWTQTGNPFFPLLSSLFGTGFDPVQKGFYDWHAGMKGGLNQFSSLSITGRIADLVSLPFRAALFPHQFEYNPIGGLIPALLPAFFFDLGKRRKDLFGIGGFSLLLFLLWGLTYRDPRFAIPLWALLALGIGAGLSGIFGEHGTGETSQRRFRAVFTLALLFWGIGQNDEVLRRVAGVGKWIDLRDSPETYLSHRLPLHPAIREVERLRSERETKPTLLLLGQEQSYYFDSPLRGADYFDGPWLAKCARDATDLEEMSSRIKEMGIDWVFVNRDVLEVNTFNVVRGALFCMDRSDGARELERIRRENPEGLSENSISRVLGSAKESDAFRRMHAWLIRHPGFEEIPLESVKEKGVPVSSHYREWLRWPELSGLPIEHLPRKEVSLLVAQRQTTEIH